MSQISGEAVIITPSEAVKMDDHLRVLKALADETRLRIVNLLFERGLCVCDLWAVLGTSQTKISRHLALLKNAGLVQDAKIAQWSFYTLTKSGMANVVDELVRGVLRGHEIYRNDLDRLKKIEEDGTCQTNITLKRNIL